MHTSVKTMEPRKLRRFNIVLDDESLLYFAGSFLTGSIYVELDEDLTTTELEFHIVGESIVKLVTSSSSKLALLSSSSNQPKSKPSSSSQPSVVADRETYIDFKLKLLSAQRNSLDEDIDDYSSTSDHSTHKHEQLLVLSPGLHTFPFKLRLPIELPSTFLGSLGWIQYFCRATLREPTGIEHTSRQVLVVINPIDLNCEPKLLQQPFVCESREKVGSICSSRGEVFVTVRLDRSGFVPGESVCISATIQNASRQSILRARAFLAETVEYSARQKPVSSETRELAGVECQLCVAPKSNGQILKQLLPIPALPPTNIKGCNLIKISHEVIFQLFLSGSSPKKPMQVRLPIVMATYPVRNLDGTLKRRKNAVYPNSLPVSSLQ